MKHNRLYSTNPTLNKWEEERYQRLMATRIKNARSAVAKVIGSQHAKAGGTCDAAFIAQGDDENEWPSTIVPVPTASTPPLRHQTSNTPPRVPNPRGPSKGSPSGAGSHSPAVRRTSSSKGAAAGTPPSPARSQRPEWNDDWSTTPAGDARKLGFGGEIKGGSADRKSRGSSGSGTPQGLSRQTSMDRAGDARKPPARQLSAPAPAPSAHHPGPRLARASTLPPTSPPLALAGDPVGPPPRSESPLLGRRVTQEAEHGYTAGSLLLPPTADGAAISAHREEHRGGVPSRGIGRDSAGLGTEAARGDAGSLTSSRYGRPLDSAPASASESLSSLAAIPAVASMQRSFMQLPTVDEAQPAATSAVGEALTSKSRVPLLTKRSDTAFEGPQLAKAKVGGRTSKDAARGTARRAATSHHSSLNLPPQHHPQKQQLCAQPLAPARTQSAAPSYHPAGRPFAAPLVSTDSILPPLDATLEHSGEACSVMAAAGGSEPAQGGSRASSAVVSGGAFEDEDSAIGAAAVAGGGGSSERRPWSTFSLLGVLDGTDADSHAARALQGAGGSFIESEAGFLDDLSDGELDLLAGTPSGHAEHVSLFDRTQDGGVGATAQPAMEAGGSEGILRDDAALFGEESTDQAAQAVEGHAADKAQREVYLARGDTPSTADTIPLLGLELDGTAGSDLVLIAELPSCAASSCGASSASSASASRLSSESASGGDCRGSPLVSAGSLPHSGWGHVPSTRGMGSGPEGETVPSVPASGLHQLSSSSGMAIGCQGDTGLEYECAGSLPTEGETAVGLAIGRGSSKGDSRPSLGLAGRGDSTDTMPLLGLEAGSRGLSEFNLATGSRLNSELLLAITFSREPSCLAEPLRQLGIEMGMGTSGHMYGSLTDNAESRTDVAPVGLVEAQGGGNGLGHKCAKDVVASRQSWVSIESMQYSWDSTFGAE